MRNGNLHSDSVCKRKAQRTPSKHTTQPGKRHTLLHVPCSPRKTVAALVRYRRTQWCNFCAVPLWPEVQLAGGAARQRQIELWHYWNLILRNLCQLQKLVITPCGAVFCTLALLHERLQIDIKVIAGNINDHINDHVAWLSVVHLADCASVYLLGTNRPHSC